MIIAKTPYRVSFAGGCSDIDSFYLSNGPGMVLNATIDKYLYTIVHPNNQRGITTKFSEIDHVLDVEQLQSHIAREALKLMKCDKQDIVIHSFGDIPPGTGLGSSSAFAVSLLHALSYYQGYRDVDANALAEKACSIEIDRLRHPIGKQDQYATAFGGLKLYGFHRDNSVSITPITVDDEIAAKLQSNLLLFFTGRTRKTSTVLQNIRSNIHYNPKIVKEMASLSDEGRQCLIDGDLLRFANVLHRGWMLKKKLYRESSTQFIDKIYNKALEAGAMGGRLLGAGQNGFFLFYCESKFQNAVRHAIRLEELRFTFSDTGSTVIFSDESIPVHPTLRATHQTTMI